MIDSTWIAEVAMSSNVVEGTELILEKRSGRLKLSARKLHRKHKLSPDFPLTRGIQEIRRQPAIGRTIRPRNATMQLQLLLLLPWLSR
ncbi:hypothetical protein [Paenibacillus tundrae]|uniref:hypothetical protein n=1 Tax=Paenibacillus tundrae TaxID=528187 RepID=UPI0027D887D8|nr:hypothetical protein [Paenibacillus tundrae]